MTAWWAGRMLAFDLETTYKLPESALIVQYGLAWVGGDESPTRHSAIVDPGIEIPDEAAAIHGITTERARAEGVPLADAVEFILDQLRLAVSRHLPIVVFNGRYDFTVMDRLARRLGVNVGDLWALLRCIDPFVLDKWLDRYRKSYPYGHTPETAAAAGIASSRTLEGMAAHYGAELDQAHDAASDAITGARIAYRIGQRGEVIRRRNDSEAWAARRLWKSARNDLDAIHAAQRDVAVAERERFAEYKRSQGELEDASRIEAECGWPVLDVMPHEPWFEATELAA